MTLAIERVISLRDDHAKGMIDMEYGQLFDAFTDFAFRLETLPSYSSPEDNEAIKRFRATGTMSEPADSSWVAFVRASVATGKRIRRLRLISAVPTEYENFELQAYRFNMGAGEDIRVAHRPEGAQSKDFWLFDDQWIAYIRYSDVGEFLGADVEELVSQGEVGKWIRLFEKATSTPRDFWE
jgi:hypothetical protein